MATLEEVIAQFPEFSRLRPDVQQSALQNWDMVSNNIIAPGRIPQNILAPYATFLPNYQPIRDGYGLLRTLSFQNPGMVSGQYYSDPSKVEFDPHYGLVVPKYQTDPTAWTYLGYPDDWQLTDPGVAAGIAGAGFGLASGLNALLGPGLAGATGAAAGSVPMWAPSLAGTAFSVGAIGPAELAMLTSAGLSASEIAALGAGVAGLGALPGAGLATGAASSAPAGAAAGAAGDIFGPPSWLANSGSNWLANMGPVASQTGATFNSSMPWYAQLAEAQTLGGSGLTAAEMGSLGVSPWAAQIGAQTWLPSLTGPGQNTGSTALNALTRITTSALNGQLGGGLPGSTTGGDGGPEFTPAPSNLQPMWGGQPNYQQFENVSFAGTAPTLLQRLERIRNG